MTTPKKGDRVKVEFEGVVSALSSDSSSAWLASGYIHVPLSACTVIAPPVKVGDLVTALNVGRLPEGSIAAVPGAEPVIRRGRNWKASDGWKHDDGLVLKGSVRVLRIGDGS